MHFFLDHHKSKLPDVKTTIFTTMSRLAKENNALNLSQGFPDFDCPKLLLEETQRALKGNFDQYAPMEGAQLLREAIAKKQKFLTAYPIVQTQKLQLPREQLRRFIRLFQPL
jgi:aspartate/methionine/tyrosine aminotransferase